MIDVEAFWSDVFVFGDNCWYYRADGTVAWPYEHARVRGPVVRQFSQRPEITAPRLAYCIAHGMTDEQVQATGLQVSHLCGNHTCINPLHLKLESQRDNLQRGKDPKRTTPLPSWVPTAPRPAKPVSRRAERIALLHELVDSGVPKYKAYRMTGFTERVGIRALQKRGQGDS